MIRSYAGIWTQIGEPAFDDDLASSLRQAATMVRATGVLVIIASEPYNRRGEQPEGSLYPENDPARVDRWNELVRAALASRPRHRTVRPQLRARPGRALHMRRRRRTGAQ